IGGTKRKTFLFADTIPPPALPGGALVDAHFNLHPTTSFPSIRASSGLVEEAFPPQKRLDVLSPGEPGPSPDRPDRDPGRRGRVKRRPPQLPTFRQGGDKYGIETIAGPGRIGYVHLKRAL